MWLQHRSVPDNELRYGTIVIGPGLQVQLQVRGIRFHEHGLLRDAGFVAFGSGGDCDAWRRAADLVVGYDVRLVRLTARQVLRTGMEEK